MSVVKFLVAYKLDGVEYPIGALVEVQSIKGLGAVLELYEPEPDEVYRIVEHSPVKAKPKGKSNGKT